MHLLAVQISVTQESGAKFERRKEEDDNEYLGIKAIRARKIPKETSYDRVYGIY